LLSNDDGYAAPGLLLLREALARIATVVTVAPEREQSAASHALSLHRPLRLLSVEPGLFAVDGTPADCIYTALFGGHRILPRPPDLVVAGLNHGLNLGDDVFYSGTVAAAREGALRGFRSVAFSAAEEADRPAAVALAAKLVQQLLADPEPRPLLLNVNFPKGPFRGVRATCLGSRSYNDDVEFRRDPRGKEYLWLGGPPGTRHAGSEHSDTSAYDRSEVGVTPLRLSLWEEAEMPRTARLVRDLA